MKKKLRGREKKRRKKQEEKKVRGGKKRISNRKTRGRGRDANMNGQSKTLEVCANQDLNLTFEWYS